MTTTHDEPSAPVGRSSRLVSVVAGRGQTPVNGKSSAKANGKGAPGTAAPVDTERSPSSTWHGFWKVLGRHRLPVAALIAVTLLAAFAEGVLLVIVAETASSLVLKNNEIHHSVLFHLQLSTGTALAAGVILAVFRLLLAIPLSSLPARIGANEVTRMRRRLFAAFTRSSWSVQAADGEGTFQEAISQQVLQASQCISQAVGVLSSGVTLVIMVGMALYVGWLTALVVIGTSAILFVLIIPVNNRGRGQARNLSTAQVEYAAGIHDAVELAEEAKVFGVGVAQEKQLDVLVEKARHAFFSTQLLAKIVPSAYQGLVWVLLAAGLCIVWAVHAQAAALGAVVLLLVRAASYGQGFQANVLLFHQCVPFVERVDAAMERYEQSAAHRGDAALEHVRSLAFREVSYEYVPGRPVLRQVTFDVEPGEVVGVVGPSGAGKSTLVQLLLGLRAPLSGRYLVNGEPAESWSSETWTKAFAYVPQEPRLLHATVAENIRFYRDIPQEQVEWAARQASIHDDVLGWERQYETVVSQRANAVSGGQRQRLCLARALAGRPSVLILDEPTSSLDPRSERLVQEALAALKGQLTIFVIAHRFSTLSICDRVMVMGDGRLEAFAPAEELRGSNDYYRHAASLSAAASL